MEDKIKMVEDRHRAFVYGDRKNPGAEERFRVLEKAEEENAKMRREWYSLKDQLHGAKVVFIIGATLLGILGVGGFATLWGALADIAKALP